MSGNKFFGKHFDKRNLKLMKNQLNVLKNFLFSNLTSFKVDFLFITLVYIPSKTFAIPLSIFFFPVIIFVKLLESMFLYVTDRPPV